MARGLKKQDNLRLEIGAKVRDLRIARRWSQTQLADQLGLSQTRLSEVERGRGSFTAEQFLVLLQIFNVSTSHFAPEQSPRDRELQNALVRLGASHLQELEGVLASERLDGLDAAICESLALGDPRLITALAPVLVENEERIKIAPLSSSAAERGLQRRLGWVLENTHLALEAELVTAPLPWRRSYQRAALILANAISWLAESSAAANPGAPDLLDPDIRSQKTIDQVRASSSAPSRRWNIVTALQPEDFAVALRSARATR